MKIKINKISGGFAYGTDEYNGTHRLQIADAAGLYDGGVVTVDDAEFVISNIVGDDVELIDAAGRRVRKKISDVAGIAVGDTINITVTRFD